MKTQQELFTSFLALPLFLCLFHSASALWPMPRTLQTGTTILKLSSNFDIQCSSIPHPPQDLLDAISRTRSRLYSDQLQRLIVGRGANDSAAFAHAPSLARLTLMLNPNSPSIKSIMEEATKDIATRSESYSLTIPITDQGIATLNASSSLGFLRGLATFEQLWYEVSGTVYSYQAPVKIDNDSPAFVRVLIMLYFMTVYLNCSLVSRIAGSCWIRQGTSTFLLCFNSTLRSCLQLYSR
jgi:hexosaminidase